MQVTKSEIHLVKAKKLLLVEEIWQSPVEVGSFIPLLTGLYTSQVVQDFVHQQYVYRNHPIPVVRYRKTDMVSHSWNSVGTIRWLTCLESPVFKAWLILTLDVIRISRSEKSPSKSEGKQRRKAQRVYSQNARLSASTEQFPAKDPTLAQ